MLRHIFGIWKRTYFFFAFHFVLLYFFLAFVQKNSVYIFNCVCLFFFVLFFLDSMQSELFVNRTVGQLLFEGYEDELLALAEMVGEKSRTPLDRFGYFYKVSDYGCHFFLILIFCEKQKMEFFCKVKKKFRHLYSYNNHATNSKFQKKKWIFLKKFQKKFENVFCIWIFCEKRNIYKMLMFKKYFHEIKI